jgi:hypothetical protein
MTTDYYDSLLIINSNTCKSVTQKTKKNEYNDNHKNNK